jgi:hypothetical protein
VLKEVENVTGRMGEGEAMAPAEEAASVAGAPMESPAEADAADGAAVAGGLAFTADASAVQAAAPAPPEATADPWAVLLQAGAQLVSALGAAGKAEGTPHPWLERDPASGASSLRLPLPPPQTARRLADALSVIADALRGTKAGDRPDAVR